MKINTNENKPVDEDCQYLLDQMYATIPMKMKLPDGSLVDVPEDGNLGLLAQGYNGIIAWRKKREELYGTRYYSPLITTLEKQINLHRSKQNDQKDEERKA